MTSPGSEPDKSDEWVLHSHAVRDWNAEAKYIKGDVVNCVGRKWKAIDNIDSGCQPGSKEALDMVKWEDVGIASCLPYGVCTDSYADYYPLWRYEINYYKDDMVRHRGLLWSSNVDTQGVEPGSAYDVWSLKSDVVLNWDPNVNYEKGDYVNWGYDGTRYMWEAIDSSKFDFPRPESSKWKKVGIAGCTPPGASDMTKIRARRCC